MMSEGGVEIGSTIAENSYAPTGKPDAWGDEFLADVETLPRVRVDTSTISLWHVRVGSQTFSLILSGIGAEAPTWIDDVVNRLNKLSILGENWDGYGARAVSQEVLIEAFRVLLSLYNQLGWSRLPHLGPTAAGGISIEWHGNDADLEIEVRSRTELFGFFDDERTEETWEGPIEPSLGEITEYVRRLAV